MKAEKNVKKYLKAIPAMLAVIMLVFAVACSPVKEKEAPGTAKTVTGVELVDSEAQEETEAASDGITALAATSSKTITATLLPEGATGEVDWAVAWQNAESTWASGKAITDYVTVTPTSDGALTATVTALKAFGEKVVITVTSRSNPQAQAQCVCDYAKRRRILSYPIEQGEFPVMKYRLSVTTLEGTLSTTMQYQTEALAQLEKEFCDLLMDVMANLGYDYGLWEFAVPSKSAKLIQPVGRVLITVDPMERTITFPADNFADNFCVLPDEEELQHNGLTQAELKSSLNAAYLTVSEEMYNNGIPCALCIMRYTLNHGNTVIGTYNHRVEINFKF